ncbi:hypothetical protein [Gracilimonas halophila]|uniref:Uncharacterized protein n=1 Tax=Gracilimonas halophila TaxID=1834464 RepID=A0ABW5JL33_9BACT
MSKFYPSVIILLLFATVVSCTRNDAQREFEQEAYSAPNNYTETAPNNGDILNNDPDDWRTSPRFQGFITVKPPFPNPVATNQTILFELDVVSQGTVNGLLVYILFDNGDRRVIYEDFDALPQGLYDFQISAISLSPVEGSSVSARGLKRIYLFDLNNRMISYGDILVEDI